MLFLDVEIMQTDFELCFVKIRLSSELPLTMQ